MSYIPLQIRILFIEDLVSDYELAKRTLVREGLIIETLRVETAEDMQIALAKFKPNIVISDYSMPLFNGMNALKLLLDFNPDIPFVMLTGSINEETAVECIKAGATDYVIKERMKRLPFAVQEALMQADAKIAKRMAESALIKSEERYRNIYENAPIGIYRTTPDGKIQMANPYLIKMLGYSSFNELSLRNLNDEGFEQESVRSKFIEIIERDGFINNFESIWRLSNGKSIHILESARVVYNENGSVAFYEGMVEDITERKKAQDAIKESEERYSKFLNSTTDIAFIKDEQLKYLFINEAGCKFFGRDNQQIIGKTDFDLLAQAYAHNCSLSDKQSLDQNKIVVTTEIFDQRVFETRKFPLLLSDGKIGVAGFIRDITGIHNAQKRIEESELKYRQLVENSMVGVYKTNTNGEFLFANTALCEILEYDSPRSLINIDIKTIYKNPADRDSFLKVIHEQSKVSNYEVDVITAKGNTKTITISAAISKNTISGMILDITDRKLFELEILAKNYAIESQIVEYKILNDDLIEARNKAEENDRLKTAFLQNLSHEIRTPMNGIIGFTQLLKEEDITFESKKIYLDTIEHSGERLMNMINDLVEISKIETGQISLNYTNFSLNALANEVLSQQKRKALDKDITLEVDQRSISEDIVLYSDKEKVIMVLSNIIGNAIKFTEVGGVKFGYLQKGSEIEFYVEDTGIGIPPQLFTSIFDRFRQGDTSISRGYEGAGLGLSISKAFIEMLDGNIWVESVQGKGSIFKFTIPNHSRQTQTLNIEKMNSSNELPNIPFRVLVVEDDAVSRMLLNEILKGLKMQVLFARNGKEALDLIEKEGSKIDFILMDLKMPIMDGFEATEKIRKFGYTKPIIAQTAYVSIEDKEKVLAGGFTSFITKPVRKENLLNALKEIS